MCKPISRIISKTTQAGETKLYTKALSRSTEGQCQELKFSYMIYKEIAKSFKSNLQEGWLSPTERASVSAISLRHILASHGYAPGTIAVNVTCMERGFNAGETHSSMYPSIFNRLRAIARYWSKFATFSYPLAFNVPVGCSHWNSGKKFGPQKTI